jgi:predicted small lipoprotein YifL
MLQVIQELPVIRFQGFRAGMIGALAVALLLAGCGRKGPLDPPPGSGLQSGAPVQAPPPAAGPAGLTGPGGLAGPPVRGARQDFDENGRPIAPPGEKKHFFLDWLLN